MTDSLIQVRVDSKLKKNAEHVFLSMGLKTPEAIRVFLQQTVNDSALPFHPRANKVPNKSTLKAFDEVDQGKYTNMTLAEFKKSLKNPKIKNTKAKTQKNENRKPSK